VQVPPSHVSVPLQNKPSGQGAVLLAWTHVPEGAEQLSSVHGLLSAQSLGAPPSQLPAPHVSPRVQPFPSSQAPPFRCSSVSEVRLNSSESDDGVPTAPSSAVTMSR